MKWHFSVPQYHVMICSTWLVSLSLWMSVNFPLRTNVWVTLAGKWHFYPFASKLKSFTLVGCKTKIIKHTHPHQERKKEEETWPVHLAECRHLTYQQSILNYCANTSQKAAKCSITHLDLFEVDESICFSWCHGRETKGARQTKTLEPKGISTPTVW